MVWRDVLQLGITFLVAVVVSILGFLLLLPTKLGERLVVHHFEAKLAGLKHDQAKEMGRLQSELDHLKDRGIRSNEREYQSVSQVWESFVDAFQATRRCIVQYQSFPDLSKLPDDQVLEFLQDENITGRSAANILNERDRNAAYSRTHRIGLIYKAGEQVLTSKELLDKQSVFIPDALSAQFGQCIDILNEARIEQYMASRSDIGPLKQNRSMALIDNDGTQIFERLRDTVRERLLRDTGQTVGQSEGDRASA